MQRAIVFLLLLTFLPLAARGSMPVEKPMEFNGQAPRLPQQVVGNAWEIYADGVIDQTTDQRLESFLISNKIPNKSSIYLNSPGGNLLAGMKLGRAIRKYGLFTYVGKQGPEMYKSEAGECYSACSLGHKLIKGIPLSGEV